MEAGKTLSAPEGAAAPPQRCWGVRLQPLPESFCRPRPGRGFPATGAHLHGAAPPPLPLACAVPRPLPLHHRRVLFPEPPRGAGCGRTVKPRRQRRQPRQERGALWRQVSSALGGGGGRAARDHFSSPHHGRTKGAAAEGSQGAPAGEWPASQRWAKWGWVSSAGAGGQRGEERAEKTTGWIAGQVTSRQLPCPSNSLGCATLGPAQDFAVGQGSDHSQI